MEGESDWVRVKGKWGSSFSSWAIRERLVVIEREWTTTMRGRREVGHHHLLLFRLERLWSGESGMIWGSRDFIPLSGRVSKPTTQNPPLSMSAAILKAQNRPKFRWHRPHLEIWNGDADVVSANCKISAEIWNFGRHLEHCLQALREDWRGSLLHLSHPQGTRLSCVWCLLEA